MNLSEALKQLNNGKDVRRKTWGKDYYIYIIDGQFHDSEGKILDNDDLWENYFVQDFVEDMENVDAYEIYCKDGEIISNMERQYLMNVIEPFKKQVVSIVKVEDIKGVKAHIEISVMGSCDSVRLYSFYKNTYYTGMEGGREYSKEELGLC